ncbi:Acyl-CoA dehydrogenase [Nocardioides exalbidus]|uniref:Dibenzothiophene monooxygenase n=1 Tax=Nocardioides exalbidus TaxID=402596 RepID=A0A1H4L1Q8_9ACTN|nr:acyl-CoA dehydrogenase family protein [Nocardioides exalbidus]SEB64308.1 Acyl-CoA dehydrogenase [Nocardioides exalbidus]
MSTQTDDHTALARESAHTSPVKPGSPELTALLDRISVDADLRDRDRIAPFEQIAWAKQAGLGRLRVPTAEGGGDASVREFFATLIALAEADSNVAHILRTHFWFVEQQLVAVDPGARARGIRLITDDKLVGNGFSEQSKHAVGLHFDTTITAQPGGGYRLNGEKFYSTGTLYSDYTQIWARSGDQRIAGAVVPVDRDGVTVEDDWDGFGQRLTATGTTRLDDVEVSEDEFFDLGDPDDQPTGYMGAFLQLYLQAVTVGILRSVRNDAVALVQRRARNFSHAATGSAAEDRQVLQVVGEISADAFAAEAIVLAAAGAIQVAYDSVVDGAPDPALAEAAQLAAAQAKVAIDRFSYATAAKLFDVGGASATQKVHNLDRHWRNARVASTHNPTFLKASAIGDHHVNGASFPGNAYF